MIEVLNAGQAIGRKGHSRKFTVRENIPKKLQEIPAKRALHSPEESILRRIEKFAIVKRTVMQDPTWICGASLGRIPSLFH